MSNQDNKQVQYITEENIKNIVSSYGFTSDDTIIESYVIKNASDSKVLGFLAEYFKVNITLTCNNEQKQLSLFIKAISRTNEAKANFVKEKSFYINELRYYEIINGDMKIPGLKPWSAKFVTSFDGVIVLDDLQALKYTTRNKFTKFDQQHTLQALNTLARFHASTYILEEKRSKELKRPYRIAEDYGRNDNILFTDDDPWYSQCREGTLEAVKVFSKYSDDKDKMAFIESRWFNVFNSILHLTVPSEANRDVLCHRDLWNNNLLFHYKTLDDGSLQPDDCVLVDFQMVYCMPPAADVMLILHCNLEPQYRKDNIKFFLDYYYNELESVLNQNNINIQSILTKDSFMSSAKLHNRWGLILCACLAQVFWTEDHLIYEMFQDSAQLAEIMTRKKGTYIKNTMQQNESYKKVLMELFEEIIEEYILVG